MAPSTYLTPDELVVLTGYARNQAAAIRRWLDQNNWVYEINRKGWPVVLRQYHDQRLGIVSDKHPSISARLKSEPNYGAFAR